MSQRPPKKKSAQSRRLSPRPSRSAWLWGGLLALLVLAVYWPTLSNGFIWDDDFYITENGALESVQGLSDIWFRLGTVPQYYPLVHSTFWLEYHLWGHWAAGYHAVNLLLHAAAVVLAWRLLVRLQVPGAWLAAALFAVHPVEVESVAWATERKNVLSCVLALAGLLAYLRFQPVESQEGEPRPADDWKWYAAAFACYVGALWSKTVTVSLPAVWLVIVWWKRGRLSWRDVLPTLPMFVVGAGMAAVTVYMERHVVGATGEDWDFSLAERFLLAGRAVWFYAGKLLWPESLAFFYYRWTVDGSLWWQYLYPLAAVALLAALFSLRGRIGRGPLAAVLIFGGVLLPALGFFDVFPFRYSFVADHFQYHASIALLALFAATGVLLAERGRANWPAWLPRLVAGGVLLTLGVLTWRQTHVYRDLTTLYEDTLAKTPTSWAAHINLGIVLQKQGNDDEAARHYRQAMDSLPAEDWNRYIGDSLALTGRLGDAAEQLTRDLETGGDPFQQGRTLSNLASVLIMQDKLDEATDRLQQVVAIADVNEPAQRSYGWKAQQHLAELFLQRAEYVQAEQAFRRALDWKPDSPEAHHGLGQALVGQKRLDESVREFSLAVAERPQLLKFRIDLADALMRGQHWPQAELALRGAVELNGRSLDAWNRLGVTLAEQGRLREAIEAFQTAVGIDPTHQGAANNLTQARKAAAGAR